MAAIYCLCNQKGGVGKTTTTINLAASLAISGLRVLIIDMDPQGNATSGVGIDKNSVTSSSYDLLSGTKNLSEIVIKTAFENLSIIPANADLTGAEVELIQEVGREVLLKNALIRGGYGGDDFNYDYVFIDCPPSLGLLTLNSLSAAERLLIPLQCEYYALEGLGQLVKTFELIKMRINPILEIEGVILTMADYRTNLTAEVIKEVKSYFAEKVFESIIPRSVKLSEAPSYGKPAVVYDPSNRGSQAYMMLAHEFLMRKKSTATLSEAARKLEGVVK